jgi:hypothetical protein
MGRLAGSVAVALAAVVSGCAWLGPESVRSGRPAYNDAILATDDAQLLQNIVRLRFADNVGFLTVSSILANVNVTASGSVDVGVGPSSNYIGNLVPFRGALSAEQNPTIAYTPVSGDNFLRQFASEVPLERAILLITSAQDRSQAWRVIVRRVNNLRNPDFPEPPALVVDPGFEETADLAGSLQRGGLLSWARLAGGQTGYAVVLHGYAPAKSHDVARLLQLLGIPKPDREGADVVIPVQLSVGSPAPGAISIETRSVFDLMRLAAASVELAADTRGAVRFPTAGPAAHDIRIRSSATAPPDPRVATQYRGRWYYIDDEDDSSKKWFNRMQLLVNAQLPDTAAGTTPLLTIPVGRR